jgi:hypothetical protein
MTGRSTRHKIKFSIRRKPTSCVIDSNVKMFHARGEKLNVKRWLAIHVEEHKQKNIHCCRRL